MINLKDVNRCYKNYPAIIKLFRETSLNAKRKRLVLSIIQDYNTAMNSILKAENIIYKNYFYGLVKQSFEKRVTLSVLPVLEKSCLQNYIKARYRVYVKKGEIK